MNAELRDILFLDIETVRCVSGFEELPERLKTQWARKAGFFKRQDDETDGDLFLDRAGIYAEFGKVVVIAVGKYTENESGELGFKTKYFAGDDEKKLLNDFRGMVDKLDPTSRVRTTEKNSTFLICAVACW